jgi:hypothetical protein
MATSTVSGHHDVALAGALACPAGVFTCSFTIMGGNSIRWRTPGRKKSGIAGNYRMRSYFLSTTPLSMTVLEGVSGFGLSSAVMKISNSL